MTRGALTAASAVFAVLVALAVAVVVHDATAHLTRVLGHG